VSWSFVDLPPDDPRLARDAFPVLTELRTELTAAQFASVYAEGHPQGLRFTAMYDDGGACVAVAGWRIVATTVALRKLYVDDLVTAAAHRRRGAGSALLAELSERASAAGCRVIDLDSALHRQDAHRFYIREGLPINAFHFGRSL
jgi:GNAT superfamily N-acetyltransferase